MSIYLNTDIALRNFNELARSKYFIDKSNILGKLNTFISTPSKYICVTKPRRFGKSSIINMLGAYYTKGYNSKDIFDKLNISKEKSYLDEENIKKFDEIKLENQERVKKANTKKKMAKMINDNRKRVRNDKDKNIKENDQKKNESKEKVEAKGTSFKKSTVGKSPNESAEEKVVKKTSTKTKKTTMTTTKKRGRPRKNTKKDVKPLATAGRTKKKDGDSKND